MEVTKRSKYFHPKMLAKNNSSRICKTMEQSSQAILDHIKLRYCYLFLHYLIK